MSSSLDSTLTPNEEIRFRKRFTKEWQDLQKETHFTFNELEQVMVMFFKIVKRDEKPSSLETIPRAYFREILHTSLGLTDSYMMERVMVALDRGTSPTVTMATFAKALSLYMRGTLEEKITYAFTCYDLLGEGYLRRETMYQLMKKSVMKMSRDDDVEEVVKIGKRKPVYRKQTKKILIKCARQIKLQRLPDLSNGTIRRPQEFVDIILKRMDADLDGVINFNDFHQSVTKSPYLLECLGYCLPERTAVYSFVATWCPNWGKM